MDLKDFSKYFAGIDTKGEQQTIIDSAQKYQGMGEGELVNELVKNIASAKESGSYNHSEMLAYANSIFPFLSEQQRTKMVELLKLIGQ